MRIRSKIIVAVAVVLAVCLVVGLTVLATGKYGTESDPLVTLSYLNDVVTPKIMSELDSKLETKSAEMEQSVQTMLSELEQEISVSGGAEAGDTFSIITLKKGQTVTCQVGTEIMLRVGTASAAGNDAPALIDSTTAGTVSAGTALTKNHMYMVTIAGNGIKATADTVKILICGSYTVS